MSKGATSGIEVDDECLQQYTDIQKNHKSGFIIFKISDDEKKIIVDEVGDRGSSYEEFFARIQNGIGDGNGRYAVFDMKFQSGDKGVADYLLFFTVVPDTLKIKKKMLMASSKDALTKRLNGLKHVFQISDMSDMEEKAVLEELKKSAK